MKDKRKTKNEINIKIRERLITFSVDILNFLKTIPYRKECEVLRYQLSKSATSIGANYSPSEIVLSNLTKMYQFY